MTKPAQSKPFQVWTVSSAQNGKRLDHALSELMQDSKGKARRLIEAGAVYLNGKRIRVASRSVREGSQVKVWLQANETGERVRSSVFTVEQVREWIVFEDDALIAFNKPSGLPTQPTVDEARDNLFALAKTYLSKRDHRPQSYLALHHRLDKDTSGLIVMIKDAQYNKKFGELFTTHEIQKTYLAGCYASSSQAPQKAGLTWQKKSYLGVRNKRGNQRLYGSVLSGGDLAITDFEILGTNEGRVLVQARPKTGRTHQIRVHLKEEGLPILGDPWYGDDRINIQYQRLFLHAWTLTFAHPVTNLQISISTSVPQDFYKDFASCLPPPSESTSSKASS